MTAPAVLESPTAPAQPAASAPSTGGPDVGAWRRVDRRRLALLLGVHPDTVTDYTRQGMPVVTRGGRGRESAYDAVECLVWWRAQQGANPKEAAQARAFEAQAAINELRLGRERQELVPREAVTLAGLSYTKAWAAKVRALPRRLIEAGVLPRDREAGAVAACREVLTEIAGWKTLADLQPSRAARRGR